MPPERLINRLDPKSPIVSANLQRIQHDPIPLEQKENPLRRASECNEKAVERGLGKTSSRTERSGAGCMEKRKADVKAVVLLEPGKWGIVVDYVLEEDQLVGKEVLVDYDEMADLNESRDGFLMIETLEVPMIKRGDTIEITIRDRRRK